MTTRANWQHQDRPQLRAGHGENNIVFAPPAVCQRVAKRIAGASVVDRDGRPAILGGDPAAVRRAVQAEMNKARE